MSEANNDFETIGYLTDNCQHISLTHWKVLRKALKRFVGKELIITVKILRYKRSLAQNRYFWVCVVKYVQNWFYETQGDKLSKDEVYTWLRVSLLKEVPKIVDIAGQEIITMTGKRFSQMTTLEFSNTVEIIRNKMAEKGCIIPEPKKHNLLYEFVLDE